MKFTNLDTVIHLVFYLIIWYLLKIKIANIKNLRELFRQSNGGIITKQLNNLSFIKLLKAIDIVDNNQSKHRYNINCSIER